MPKLYELWYEFISWWFEVEVQVQLFVLSFLSMLTIVVCTESNDGPAKSYDVITAEHYDVTRQHYDVTGQRHDVTAGRSANDGW